MITCTRRPELAPVVNAYENRLYGPDFWTDLDAIGPWLASPMFFWTCCLDEPGVPSPDEVLGCLSILVTTEDSAAALYAGELREAELEPWTPNHKAAPALYYCSFSAARKGVGRSLFAEAGAYFRERRFFDNAQPSCAFAISVSEGGANHLQRAGFHRHAGRYLDKYDIHTGVCSPELDAFWTELLRCPDEVPSA